MLHKVEKMRFLGDMGISPRVIKWLIGQGHDAIHLHDEGLGRLSDTMILEKARTEQRIVLTHDLDFGYLMALGNDTAPGVVLFRLTDMSADSVSAHLALIIPQLAQAASHSFVVVSDSGTRIRMLPIRDDESRSGESP